jgi:hypothetical protein
MLKLIFVFAFTGMVQAALIPPQVVSEGFTNATNYEILFQDFDQSLGSLTGVTLNLGAKIGLTASSYTSAGGNAAILGYGIEDGAFFNIFNVQEPCSMVGYSATCWVYTQKSWGSLAGFQD